MKKIYAILISALFVVSVFGVASVLGNCCEPSIVSSSTVRVGDRFTFKAMCNTLPTVTGTGAVQLVSGPTKIGAGISWITEYRAISPGDVHISVDCNCPSDVKIISRDLPFKFFAKLFGLGKPE